MNDVFISFASKETDEANRICRYIEEHGYRCFISTRDLIPGEEYAAQLIENIGKSRAVVLLLSEASNNSPHVLREIEYAVGKHIPILVYSLEKVTLTKSMEYYLMPHQWITSEKAMDQVLISGIKHIVTEGYAPGGNGFSLEDTPPAEPKAPSKAEDTKPAVKTTDAVKKNKLPLFVGIAAAVLLVVGCIILLPKLFHGEEEVPDTTPDSEAIEAELPVYQVGDTVIFGNYSGEPIEWRVIQTGDGTVTLISKYILSLKTFDAAEGGQYNYYEDTSYWSYENHNIEDPETLRLVRGNNDWSICNLRTWLNSSEEYVNYPDQAPTLHAVGDYFYSSEPGFLHGFTDAERAALVEVTHSSTANIFSAGAVNGQVTTTDRVYLLSSRELSLLTDAGMAIFAEPTEACKNVDKDKETYSSFVGVYHINSYYWWLRDNAGDKLNEAYVVNTEVEQDQPYSASSVGVSACGVRPVICVVLSKADLTTK